VHRAAYITGGAEQEGIMPSRRDEIDLSAWLTTQLMHTLTQTMHNQGIAPKEVPYGWRALQALEHRVRQHADALAGDFTAALQAIKTYRHQYGPPRGAPMEATPGGQTDGRR
jgi:hypothetical protein